MPILLLLVLIVAVLALVAWIIYLCSKQKEEPPASDWLAAADTFAVTWTLEAPPKPWEWEWDALAQSRVPFITHCPNNAEFLRRAQALGVRCFPYVQFYWGFDSVHGDPIHPAGNIYQGFNYASEDFKWRDVSGQPILRLPYGDGAGFKGDAYQVCQNIDGFATAIVNWVDHVMSLGADGVFIDCVSDSAAGCYGASVGKHVHQIPDPDPATPNISSQAYAALLKRVHDVVHAHHGLVIGNTWAHDRPVNDGERLTKLPASFWQEVDAGFLESYMYPVGKRDKDSSAWTDPLLDDTAWAAQWQEYLAIATPPAFQSGSLPILASTDINQYVCVARYAGPYPGLPADLIANIPDYGVYIGKRDYAFLSYATARLAGFLWNAATYVSHSSVADLYRLRLGRPLTPKLVAGQVHYRVFECGIVAVNADPAASAPLPNIGSGLWGAQPNLMVDAFIAGLPGRLFKNYSGGSDHYATFPPDQFQIPPISGRVYLFASDMIYLQT